ncbi:MAG: hypothetical protein ACRDL0_16175 [Thermoleophilaceae bacterium]
MSEPWRPSSPVPRAAHGRPTGTPWPDLDWLRDELGMGSDQLAA